MTPHFTLRSSAIFPDADKFDPYRWLNAEKDGKKAELEKYFVPFGKGSRNCVGLKCVYFGFLPCQSYNQSVEANAYPCDIVLHTRSCI